MVGPGFTRWALIIVVVALVLALVTAAAVVLASSILQPQVVPKIKVQPPAVKPGDIVVVTGEGFPNLANLVLVIALSPNRDLASESLLPVSAAPVGLDGRVAATFVFPADVPWIALREAWVVARPSSGNLQAVARLAVQRLQPTRQPTACPATTPMPGKQQIQGAIIQLAPGLGMLTLRPFDGSGERGVAIRTATVRFADGRQATLGDLKVGLGVAVVGWFDSGGTLLAEQLVILEAGQPVALSSVQVSSVVQSAPAEAQVAAVNVPACTPTVAVCPQEVSAPTCTPAATTCPQVVSAPPAPACTPIPSPIPTCTPTCTPEPVICQPVEDMPPCGTPVDRWCAEFFADTDLTDPLVAAQEYNVIDLNWYQDPPAPELQKHCFSVRWKGNWCFRKAGLFRFVLLLRGKARLWVDGELVIDQWDNPPAGEYTGNMDLEAGVHSLQLDYAIEGEPARVQLRWEEDGIVP